MIINVKVMNQQIFVRDFMMLDHEKYKLNCISIRDSSRPLPLRDASDRFLPLNFDDLDPDEHSGFGRWTEKYSIFDDKQAREVVDFLESIRHRSQEEWLVVHCAAGVSRSAAIGLWAVRYFALNEESFRKIHTWIRPNKYVTKLLDKALLEKTKLTNSENSCYNKFCG